MEYRVQGYVSPNTVGEFALRDCTVGEWVDADTPLEAASIFIMNHPEVNNSPILTVDRDYNIGNYPLDNVKINIDYMLGLRWRQLK